MYPMTKTDSRITTVDNLLRLVKRVMVAVEELVDVFKDELEPLLDSGDNSREGDLLFTKNAMLLLPKEN